MPGITTTISGKRLDFRRAYPHRSFVRRPRVATDRYESLQPQRLPSSDSAQSLGSTTRFLSSTHYLPTILKRSIIDAPQIPLLAASALLESARHLVSEPSVQDTVNFAAINTLDKNFILVMFGTIGFFLLELVYSILKDMDHYDRYASEVLELVSEGDKTLFEILNEIDVSLETGLSILETLERRGVIERFESFERDRITRIYYRALLAS